MSETVTGIIERLSVDIAGKAATRKSHSDSIKVITDAMGREGRSATTPAEDTVIDQARSAMSTVAAVLNSVAWQPLQRNEAKSAAPLTTVGSSTVRRAGTASVRM